MILNRADTDPGGNTSREILEPREQKSLTLWVPSTLKASLVQQHGDLHGPGKAWISILGQLLQTNAHETEKDMPDNDRNTAWKITKILYIPS